MVFKFLNVFEGFIHKTAIVPFMVLVEPQLVDVDDEEEKGQDFSASGYLVDACDSLVGEKACLLYTSPSPRDQRGSRMPSSA